MHPLSKRALSLEAYRHGSPLIFDFETTNLEKGSALNPDNHVVMVAWKANRHPVQHFYGNILDCSDFWAALDTADFLVAQNAKFEAHWLRRLGVDPTDYLWFDTFLAEYVLAGNRFRKLDLGAIASRYGYRAKDQLIDTMMKVGICPSEMPKRRLIARCRRDTYTTARIHRRQLTALHGSGRLGVALTRCLTAPVLTQIETEGMCLDGARVHETYAETAKRLAVARSRLDHATGGINPRSTDQVAEYLYGTLGFREPTDSKGNRLRNKPSKRWPGGKPKTDKQTMDALRGRATSRKQKEYIDLRQEFGSLNAAVTKNLEFFKGVVDERDNCTFYGTIRQGVARTHRLTSNGVPQSFAQFPKPKSVQFHNMPRAFKRLFKARDKEWVMVEADASQLEFRVAVFLGKDRQGLADIMDESFDAHKYTASVLLGKPASEICKSERQDAKADTFKPLYGGTQGTDAQERYYATFQSRYHELHEEQKLWVNEVLSHSKGMLKTAWGMRFYWKFHLTAYGTPMWGGKSIEPSVFNYPVQSLATAEIIPIALVYLYYRTKKAGLRVRFVNTVHDSVIAEVHRGDLADYTDLVRLAFGADIVQYLKTVYDLEFNVPLGVEIVAGQHWSEGTEEQYEYHQESHD